MPHLKELYAAKKDQGLVLIGIHTTNGADKMPEFVKAQGIAWPVAVDDNNKTVKAFGANSYPDYFLIDRAGNLRFADLANSELDRAVEALLAEKAPEAGGDNQPDPDKHPDKDKPGSSGGE